MQQASQGAANSWWETPLLHRFTRLLVGMGTAFAGIVRAPMTSVLMIFEMTQDYAVIVPLMISNLVSLFISSRLQKTPIYEALAIQDGIHLPGGHSQRRNQRQIVRVMRKLSESLSAETTVREASKIPRSNNLQSWLVTDGPRVIGVINRETLERQLPDNADQKLGNLLDAIHFPHAHADQSLDLALERMGANRVQLLPVVSRADVHQLLGIVTLRDVLDSYGVRESDSA